MKEKLAVWVSQRHAIPYRLRESFIEKTCPKILSDYPFEINFYGMKYVGNTKDNTDRLFFLFGGCEKYMLAFMRDYCKASEKDNFTFIDVGAHVGNHSLFMSNYASEIHAFEPNLTIRESLNSKIYMNKIENITVHPLGLGNVNEERSLSYSGEINDNQNQVDIRIGDEILNEREVGKVHMIKVDIDGAEREVIEGLQNTIESSRPLIITEISNDTRRTFGTKDDFESIFPKDYCFYYFSGVSHESEKYKIESFNYDKHKQRAEVIAIPKEKRIYLKEKVVR